MIRESSTLPLFHTHDPPSSREAIQRHTVKGTRQTHCDQVYALVKLWPDHTSRELAAKTSAMDLTELRRRLTDLLNKGLILQSGVRQCYIAQTSAVTWRACGLPESTP